MANLDIVVYAMGTNYTDEEVAGGGAIKGKNCVVDSITDITGGHRVTFKWTLDNGTVTTGSMDVMNGTKGEKGEKGDKGDDGINGKDGKDGRGIKSSYVNAEDHFIIVYDDDTEEDCGAITVVGVDKLSELTDVDLEGIQDGDTIVYDAVEEKFKAGQGGAGDSSLSKAVTSNLAVGAISSGTTLAKGTTFTQFVEKLLITEIAPTVGFTISKSGNVVYGSSYTETLTVNVSAMGTAKKIKTIAWYQGSTLLRTDTIDSTTTGSWTYTMGTATTDTTTFKAVVTYTKSSDTDESITKTASINFYYNKFYGAVDSLTPSEATVEALTTALGTGKGGTYSFTVTAGRICYAYPKSLGALTSIKDGNGFSLFDSFTRTEQTYTQNGTSVAYYRYVLTDATTVSGYSVIFA